MKLPLPILIALLTLTPQPGDDEASLRRHQAQKGQVAPLMNASLIEICNDIEAEQRKSCASACASAGQSFSFEDAICGIGSTCKCL